MRLSLSIEPEDVQRVRCFLAQHEGNAFVRHRRSKNLGEKPDIDKDRFWECMVACLLSTQQRAGPTSAVSRFITPPFPLNYQLCRTNQADLAEFIRQTLTDFGGIRRGGQIGAAAKANMDWLEDGGWTEVFQVLNSLDRRSTAKDERRAATFIDEQLLGFGPKQSRNLLQMLGLSRFEIPIDSRITKWLTDFGFPVKLSATALGDQAYYEFVMDALQQLCEEVDVFPCILDAAIFSSFDDGEWTEQNVIW